jgi:hypothetical protein
VSLTKLSWHDHKHKVYSHFDLANGVEISPASGPGSLEDFTIRAKATKGKSK